MLMSEHAPQTVQSDEDLSVAQAPAKQGWDALSIVLMALVVMLGVMYFMDARREDVLTEQSQRAKQVDTMKVWGKRCGLSAVGQSGRTLMVRCAGDSAQAVAAKAVAWRVPQGFDAVAFVDDARTFVCRAPERAWPDGCTQHIALDAQSLKVARRRQTRREQ